MSLTYSTVKAFNCQNLANFRHQQANAGRFSTPNGQVVDIPSCQSDTTFRLLQNKKTIF